MWSVTFNRSQPRTSLAGSSVSTRYSSSTEAVATAENNGRQVVLEMNAASKTGVGGVKVTSV